MTIDATQPAAASTSGIVASGGRVKRAALTWTSGAVYTGVTLLVGLIATPKIVHFLGESRFGAFRAVVDWMGYLQLADLGLGSAFAVLLLRARAGADASDARASDVVGYGLRLLGKLTLFAVVIGAVMAWFMPQLIRGGAEFATELRICAAIGLISLAFSPLLILRSYLETSQRGYRVHAALLVQSLLVTGLAVLLAWRGWGLVGQSIATVSGSVVFVILVTRWSVRTFPKKSTASPANLPKPRTLWSLAWPLAAAGAGNRINLLTDTIVIGKMLGSVEVAMLFLTQRIISLAAAQVNSMANASWAGLAELREAGQRALFEARLTEIVRLIVGAGIVLVGTIAAFNVHFVRLWVGSRLYGGDLLCIATVASVVTFGFLLPFSWAIDMAGDTRHRLLVSTIGSILNLVLSIIFVQWIGLAGVAIATCCAYLLTDAWYSPLLVCRRYGVRGAPILAAVARGLAFGLPWSGSMWILARMHTPPFGWAGLIGEAVLIGTASLLYCGFAIMTTTERAAWRRRFARLRGARE